MTALAEVQDSSREAFRHDVIAGLSQAPRSLPCRWLYDDRGSALFEDITALPEYYPTRTELGILEASLPEIARFIGPGTPVIEYGAGSGRKSELLLAAVAPARYIPVDIAEDFLGITARRLAARFPDIEIQPIVADFTAPFDSGLDAAERRAAFFPGSTIGNLDAAQIEAFLARMRGHVGAGGCAVIGMDLVKPLDVLLPAYDDAQGVTAEFNRNLLRRINRELGGTFDLAAFRHEARWNAGESAVEMHLVSTADQTIAVAGTPFAFREGETIHTESSRKFDLAAFSGLARQAGWQLAECWTDPDDLFALVGLTTLR